MLQSQLTPLLVTQCYFSPHLNSRQRSPRTILTTTAGYQKHARAAQNVHSPNRWLRGALFLPVLLDVEAPLED